MNDIKDFWRKHPYLMKMSALVMLIVSPLLFTVVLFVHHWDDVTDMFSELWRIVTAKVSDIHGSNHE